MNKFVFSFIFFLFSFYFSSFAYAQDAPKISFGSIYYTKGATVVPGSNFSYDIYFFVDSEYGDRTAHISISLSKPEEWEVYVLPALETNTYNISGALVNATENIYVEPRPKLQSIPEEKEEGIYYIASPSGKGYLQAKKVTIYVNVPSDAEIGKSYVISATATAKYFGDLGSVAFSQSRGFDFTVTTKPATYTEQIVKPSNNTDQTNSTSNGSEVQTPSQLGSNQSESTLSENQSTNPQTQSEGNDLLNYVIIAVIAGAVVYFAMNYLNANKKPYKNYKIKNNKKDQEDEE